jgi:hypothetical protein
MQHLQVSKEDVRGWDYSVGQHGLWGEWDDLCACRQGTAMSPATATLGHDKPMTGWVLVEPAGVASQADLRRWIDLGVGYALTLPPK